MYIKTYFNLFLILSIFVIINLELSATELQTDSKTLLLLDFNNNTKGKSGELPINSENVIFEEGIIGKGAYFGPNSLLEFDIENNFDNTKGTVECWLNFKSDPKERIFRCLLNVDGLNGSSIWIVDFFDFIFNSNSGKEEDVIHFYEDQYKWKINHWHHFAVTWNKDSLTYYSDGKKLRTQKFTSKILQNSASKFSIGGHIGESNLDAIVDEFRISSEPRSEDEIRSSYYAGLQTIGLKFANDIFHLKPSWERTIITHSISPNGDLMKISPDSVIWKSLDPNIVRVLKNGKMVGVDAGTTKISGTFKNVSDTFQVVVEAGTRSTDPGDLDVLFVHRYPEIAAVTRSLNARIEGWPSIGQEIKWQANVKNRARFDREIEYVWKIDGNEVKTGKINIPALSLGIIEFPWNWSFDRHIFEIIVDPNNKIPEEAEDNNSLTFYSNALMMGIYAEDSVYNYWREYQHNLPIKRSNSFEDYIQRHAIIWNKMLEDAIYPETPNGVIDRIRVDKIVVLEDSGLPISGAIDDDDLTKDMQWAWPNLVMNEGMYDNNTDTCENCRFYNEVWVFHEMTHHREFTDVYGANVGDENHKTVAIKENDEWIAGSSYLPYIAWGSVLYFTPVQGLMNNQYTYVDRFTAICYNMINGMRAGSQAIAECPYFKLTPERPRINIKDSLGTPLEGVSVKIYQAICAEGIYGKFYDNDPEYSFITDKNGQAILPRNFFDTSGVISTPTISPIFRFEYKGHVEYKFIDIFEFIFAYWRNIRDTFDFDVNLKTKHVEPEVSVDDSKNISISVYPNPAQEYLILDYENIEKSQNSGYSIFSILGEMMYKTESLNNGSNLIDISSLPIGVYFIEVYGFPQSGKPSKKLMFTKK